MPEPLLLLSFILKLTIVTLFYSIFLLHKRIVFNMSLTLLLVLSPKLLNFITLLLFLKISTGSRLMRESNTKLSLTYKSLKTGKPSYLRSFLSFPSHRSTQSSSFITLSRPSLTSRFKIANRSFYHSAPVLWNYLPSHLRQVVHHVTPSISKLASV